MKHTLIRTVPDEPAEAFSGCGHPPAPAARRVAGAPPIYIDGVHVPESAIAAEAQNHEAGSGPEARAAAARALVIRHLLLRRAEELALTPDPIADDRGRVETPEEALIRQVLETEAPGQEPTDAECLRAYEASKAKFAVPEVYEAAHILFQPEAPGAAAWVAAHRQAVAAIEKLREGASFAALARTYSACPTGEAGGSLGQLTRGDLASALESVLLTLEAGAVALSPVRSQHGWHVLRLERRSPARVLPFDAVAEEIRGALRARSAVAASARYVERLAAGANIEGLSLSAGANS